MARIADEVDSIPAAFLPVRTRPLFVFGRGLLPIPEVGGPLPERDFRWIEARATCAGAFDQGRVSAGVLIGHSRLSIFAERIETVVNSRWLFDVGCKLRNSSFRKLKQF